MCPTNPLLTIMICLNDVNDNNKKMVHNYYAISMLSYHRFWCYSALLLFVVFVCSLINWFGRLWYTGSGRLLRFAINKCAAASWFIISYLTSTTKRRLSVSHFVCLFVAICSFNPRVFFFTLVTFHRRLCFGTRLHNQNQNSNFKLREKDTVNKRKRIESIQLKIKKKYLNLKLEYRDIKLCWAACCCCIKRVEKLIKVFQSWPLII